MTSEWKIEEKMEVQEINLFGVPVLPRHLLVRSEDNSNLSNILADFLTTHFTDTRQKDYHPSQLVRL
jgi:hypothetical protein